MSLQKVHQALGNALPASADSTALLVSFQLQALEHTSTCCLCDRIALMHNRACMQAVSPKQAVLELLTVLLQSSTGLSEAQWQSLMPVLLASYGATMSPTDQATLRLLCTLNAQKVARQPPVAADEAQPFSKSCVWMTAGIAGMG